MSVIDGLLCGVNLAAYMTSPEFEMSLEHEIPVLMKKVTLETICIAFLSSVLQLFILILYFTHSPRRYIYLSSINNVATDLKCP